MQYSLDRLDAIVSGELNPQHNGMMSITALKASAIVARIQSETILIRKYLWDSLQDFQNKDQLKILALQYTSSLDYLLEEVRLYKTAIQSASNVELKKLMEQVEHIIGELFSFVQRHFSVWIIPETKAGDIFLHTGLNEQEITILLCALIDAGIISNHTYTSFLELAGPVIATKRKKGLNGTSMLKSRDKITADMKKKIKDLLLQMARVVDSY